MENIVSENIYLVLLLPLWIFLIVMVGRFFSVYVNNKVIGGLTLISSVFGTIICTLGLLNFSSDKVYESSYPFVKINDFIISCGIHVDQTALTFGLILFVISFFVQGFALSYMREDKKFYRFFALLNLFSFGMAGLFFSPNLYQTYFFWEIVSIASYLLIGYEYNNPLKSLAAKKVFIINRIGDTALIGGIIMCSYLMYAYSPSKSLATLSYVDMPIISTFVSAYTPIVLFYVICALFIIAAIVKSAQFPFYTWLQDAMEAKLPVSALLHSATLVAAGVFLTIKLLPVYTMETYLPHIIAAIGLITAFVCSLCACAQNHPKKTLAYSTSAQFGLIYFALGMLNTEAAIAFLAAHALIKSMLFLTLPHENKKWDYANFIAFLIGGLSLSGLIFAGMISKEMIALNLSGSLKIIFCIISFLTAFYIMRIALITADFNELEKRRPNIVEFSSVAGLLILNIILYVYLRRYEYKIAEPFWAALFGWICVYILYINKGFKQIPFVYQLAYNGFYLDKFYSVICVKIYNTFSNICAIFDTKVLSEYRPFIVLAKTGVKISEFIETKIMNGAVNCITNCAKKLSLIDLRAQNGSIQRYNAYAFIIITIIITCLVLAYTAVIGYLEGGGGIY